MQLILSEEERLLSETAADFFKTEAPVSRLRALRDGAAGNFVKAADQAASRGEPLSQDINLDSERGYEASLWQKMAELGLTGVMVGEDFGGSQFGAFGAGLIAEAAGYHLSASPFTATAVLAAYVFENFASKEQKARYLDKIAAGSLIVSFALDETSRHKPEHMGTKAVQRAQGWQISGYKNFAPEAKSADLYIVNAVQLSGGDRMTGKDGQEPCGLFLIEKAANGLLVEGVTMADSRNYGHVTMEASPAVRIGEGEEDQQNALHLIYNLAYLMVAGELIGLSRFCLDTTRLYLSERQQFGALIGSFQALQHRLGQWLCDYEMARSAFLAGLRAFAAFENYSSENTASQMALVRALGRSTSLAKAKACQLARLATGEAIQMHGGMGMTDALDLGFYMKRAQSLIQLYGDDAFHKARFAALSGF